MKEKNITALVSSFVRYYHHKNSNIKVYDDKNCDKVLTFEEYLNIKENMVDGIKYFNPSFKGTEDDAILWIVNNQIGPSVLGRSAFNKKMLKNAIKLGCGQYLVYASGYDTNSSACSTSSLRAGSSAMPRRYTMYTCSAPRRLAQRAASMATLPPPTTATARLFMMGVRLPGWYAFIRFTRVRYSLAE
mgnify:CR=1 FL=1